MNSSLWQGLPHQKALELLFELCFPECCLICTEQKTSCLQFMCKNFVSKGFASSVTQEDHQGCLKTLIRTGVLGEEKKFLWEYLERTVLTAAQVRESPFSQLLGKSEFVQCHLALLHQTSSGDWPTKQCGLVSTKASLTSAVMEPGVTIDDESLFSTAASDIFSETPEEMADYDSKSI